MDNKDRIKFLSYVICDAAISLKCLHKYNTEPLENMRMILIEGKLMINRK